MDLNLQIEQIQRADPQKSKRKDVNITIDLPISERTGHLQLRRGNTTSLEKSVWENGFTLGKNNKEPQNSSHSEVQSALPLDLADETGGDISTINDIELHIKPNEKGGYTLRNYTSETKIIWDNSNGTKHEIQPGEQLTIDDSGFRTYVGEGHKQYLNISRGTTNEGNLEDNINISHLIMDTDQIQSRAITELPTQRGIKQLKKGKAAFLDKSQFEGGILFGRTPNAEELGEYRVDMIDKLTLASTMLGLGDETGEDIPTVHKIELFIQPQNNGGYVVTNLEKPGGLARKIWVGGNPISIEPGQAIPVYTNTFMAEVGTGQNAMKISREQANIGNEKDKVEMMFFEQLSSKDTADDPNSRVKVYK